LKDGSELVDRQLISLEGDKEPAPRWVGEGCHLTEKGWRAHMVNPFIRIKE
jgi:hypothetical protein